VTASVTAHQDTLGIDGTRTFILRTSGTNCRNDCGKRASGPAGDPRAFNTKDKTMTKQRPATGTGIPRSPLPRVVTCRIRKRGATVLYTKTGRRNQRLTGLEKGARS
jgi:hypothetical protein